MELAYAVEAQDGRIHTEKINYPFLFQDGTKPCRIPHRPQARECGWRRMHESGTHVKITPARTELFA